MISQILLIFRKHDFSTFILIVVFSLDSSEWNHFCKNVTWTEIKSYWRISKVKVGVIVWNESIYYLLVRSKKLFQDLVA